MRLKRRFQKLICAVRGHRWVGPFADYGDMPSGIRGCRRCGVWNYDLCDSEDHYCYDDDEEEARP